jgi:hypothetical protein
MLLLYLKGVAAVFMFTTFLLPVVILTFTKLDSSRNFALGVRLTPTVTEKEG